MVPPPMPLARAIILTSKGAGKRAGGGGMILRSVWGGGNFMPKGGEGGQ